MINLVSHNEITNKLRAENKILQKRKEKLLEALLAVYGDIELQNVKGGSDELNFMVQQAIAEEEQA